MQKERKMQTGRPKPHKKQAGFTLVEVMVTLVIIGLMATIVVVTVLPMMRKANGQKASIDISNIGQAIEYYYLDTNHYPEKLDELLGGTEGAGNKARPEGYIKALPNDPWGHPYNYIYPGEHGVYDLWSWGADGEQGGEGDNADITNWKDEG